MADPMSTMTGFLEYGTCTHSGLHTKLTRHRQLESEHVTVLVGKGDSAKRFSIPKDLLRLRSQWFNNALKTDRFTEGRTGDIELPEDDTDVFQAFLFFLHTGKLAFPLTLHDTSEQRGFNLLLCFRIWCFGDKYCLSQLQNAAMHWACLGLEDRNHDQVIEAAYLAKCFHIGIEHLPLRVVIADYYVKLVKEEGLDIEIDSSLGSCPQFFVELHASEASFHKLADGDFPRYLKPTKHADLLYVGYAESECWYGYDSVEADGKWAEPTCNCSYCGFKTYMHETQPYCKKCQRKPPCKCRAYDWSFLCPDCRPDEN